MVRYMYTTHIPTKKLVTLTEAAATLGISYSLMRKFVKQGRVKVIRVGKSLLIPEEEVERLIKELAEGGG
jgi:excisionase family DNA binding protein